MGKLKLRCRDRGEAGCGRDCGRGWSLEGQSCLAGKKMKNLTVVALLKGCLQLAGKISPPLSRLNFLVQQGKALRPVTPFLSTVACLAGGLMATLFSLLEAGVGGGESSSSEVEGTQLPPS